MRFVLFLALLCACGEIERADLVVIPRADDFASDIQPLLLAIGCSPEGTCHDIGQGEVLIKRETGAAALDDSYLSVKAQLDLEDPPASRIIQSVLRENTASQHFPPDCIAMDGCAYQKLVAWIAWTEEGDPRPGEIECDASAEGCFR